MSPRKRAIGALLAAYAAMALHPALADPGYHSPSPKYELHAYVDVDGIRQVDTDIGPKQFENVMACINFAETLPEPKKSESRYGHYINYGYTCVRVSP